MIRKRSRLRGGDADGQVQTFRSPTAMVVWVVWLLFAAANWIDLAVQHPDHTSAVAAGVLLLGTGVAYAAALRPRIIADTTGITVRNPLRDHAIGWAGVTKVDLADLLRVHCRWDSGPASSVESAESTGSAAPGQRTKVIPAWAVHYSRRRQLAAESRARRASGPRGSAFGFPSVGGVLSGGRGLPSGDRGYPAGGAVATPSASVSAAEADAEMVCRLLNERATAAQAETVWATGTGTQTAAATAWLEPLKSTWSGKAIAAILIPALILLIICLI
jgi:PH (Pleckstrin Homology) domain-containing protein